MHVEFRNTSANLNYYLCGPRNNPCAIAYDPTVGEVLVTLDQKMQVTEVFDLIRPVVDKLIENNRDEWEVRLFMFSNLPRNSLTYVDLVRTYGVWYIGDSTYINGVKQPTSFVSQELQRI